MEVPCLVTLIWVGLGNVFFLIYQNNVISHPSKIPFSSIKSVFVVGKAKFKVETNVKVTQIELREPTNDEIKLVKNFEHEANKSTIVSYNFSSGSTGPAKMQMFKETVNWLVKNLPKKNFQVNPRNRTKFHSSSHNHHQLVYKALLAPWASSNLLAQSSPME